jgi:4-amino-4-deoxy-L-arabinose transferase-like glycosyltransferase
MTKVQKLIFIIILSLSVITRTYKLLTIPPGLFSDEADAGYQAYVFNQCQTDYFGNKFPTHFHSYADWRTPLYVYTIALFQKIIGYNDLAVRLPSSIYGILCTIIFFLIIKKIFKNNWLSLFGFFLISISPWNFHYSRAAWEVTGMIFVYLLGIYFWLIFIEKKRFLNLLLSIFFFLLMPYFYATAKLFIVFIFLSAFFIWPRKILCLSLKQKFIAIIFSLLILFPLIKDIISGNAGFRFSYINIFNSSDTAAKVNFYRQEDSFAKNGEMLGVKPSLLSQIIHNKPVIILSFFWRNYVSSFSTDYLFLTGDNYLRQGFQKKGNLLYPDLVFILIGLSSIILINRHPKNKSYDPKIGYFFLLLLIFSPIAFSLTNDSMGPQSTRLILMSPSLIFLTVTGFYCLISLIRKTVFHRLAIITICVIYLLSFLDVFHFYFIHYPNLSARFWHVGMGQAVTSSLKSNFSQIYYSNSYEPFMPFFYYYARYLPSDGSCSAGTAVTWTHTDFFDGMVAENKYFFGQINLDSFLRSKSYQNSLLVIPEEEFKKITKYLEQFPVKIQIKTYDIINKQYSEQVPLYLISLYEN